MLLTHRHMHIRPRNSNRGFIALVTVLIMSSILLMLLAVSALGSFYARSDGLGRYEKRVARSLADSCAEVALLDLARAGSGYQPHDREINVDDGESCMIGRVEYGEYITITTRASVNDAYAESVVTLSHANMSVVSWKQE